MIASEFPGWRVVFLDTNAALGNGAGDGGLIHPNDAGHTRIAKAALDLVIARLPTQDTVQKARVPGPDVQYARRVPESGVDPRMGGDVAEADTTTETGDLSTFVREIVEPA